MRNFNAAGGYILKRNKALLSVFLIILFISLIFLEWPATFSFSACIKELQNTIGLATLGAALLVFIIENRQDWETGPPRRLTVNFFFEDHPAMRYEDTFLADESEIPSWGQQIGAQMCGARKLQFKPGIVLAPSQAPAYDPEEKQQYQKYEASFFLTEPPTPEESNPDWNDNIEAQKTLVWRAPSFADRRETIEIDKNP